MKKYKVGDKILFKEERGSSWAGVKIAHAEATIIGIENKLEMYQIKKDSGFFIGQYKDTIFVHFDDERIIDNIVFKTVDDCVCGAKHTSNPKHHLKFCEVK